MYERIPVRLDTISGATLRELLQDVSEDLDLDDRYRGHQIDRVEIGQDGYTGEWFMRIYGEDPT